ncbi:hypothetical protein KUTeg_002028 [Tegillarca granosa]|uniref:NHR domain-containing protein n=1 Tax=Tegillarca granosa TaxID=220873 RepID=A0ABQ9FWC1_TEGGR|nr:hypothetical protein KUTeg_002028 [Tegillarca granosa]
MASKLQFHSRTGSLVTLSNDSQTAQRNHPTQEFNNGVVLSSETLKDNQIFEVKIDKKVNSWSGSIEIGVTTCEPSSLNFPVSATGFREGTWVMSGSSILKDGHSVIEEYGQDLDQLSENDKVGVMRTSQGALHFFVNGEDQGVAASSVPADVFAVVDMYGKCAQVSIIQNSQAKPSNRENSTVITNDVASQLANEFLTQLSNQIVNDLARNAESMAMLDNTFVQSNERLTFHERCGSLVKLTNNRRTAERRKPMDEFNNGVVMTNRPLKNDEMFEFPATMTNMRSGTIMMSGCGILTNGKGTRREYGQYNLDELAEGDRIGLMRKSNGHLHYYINGQDQGIAATETPTTIWGVVDLYGMAVKVTILDRNDPSYNLPIPGRRTTKKKSFTVCIFLMEVLFSLNALFSFMLTIQFTAFWISISVVSSTIDNYQYKVEEFELLTFDTRCGSHAAVINGSKTAHRPNALDDFNNGVVLTSRHLKPDELFEVRIDKMVDKWAGSIEIGVTLHSSTELDFPSTMTNIRSGTWMMTGNGVMHNGTTVIDEYGQNLDRLKTGDRVGVRRKPDGTLHFYVNGVDQGPAACSVPEAVYGVIDLYGQAAQATIVDHSDSLRSPDADTLSTTETEELRFHTVHGQNATVLVGGRTAVRPNATGEFNDAIVMSSRPLKDNELFEVIIEKMVERWSGSIEAAIMQDGCTIRNGYPLDLDLVTVGCRIGMMRCSDGSLHYYYNGQDQGIACTDLPHGVYAVVDLYGQCAQVSITSGSGVLPPDNILIQGAVDQSVTSPLNTEVTHRFSQCCGKNVTVKNNGATACRSRNYNHGVVFSSDPLKRDELFEFKIDQITKVWSGSLHIGLTTLAISDSTSVSLIPARAVELTSKVTWVVTGSEVRKNGVVIKENYTPSLERLEPGNRVGVKRNADGTMHIYLNGEDLGIAASNIPKQSQSLQSDLVDNTEPDRDQDLDTTSPCSLEFHSNHGKNIMLSNDNLTGCRQSSYNQGIMVTNRPLPRNKLFQIRIDELNSRWNSSLMIGVLGFPHDRYNFPVSSLHIKKSCTLIQGNAVYSCGNKIKEQYGPDLNQLQCGHIIGILVDDDASLHLYVNGVDQGIASKHIPNPCYVIVDLYGKCEQVTIVPSDGSSMPPLGIVEDREKADIDDVVKEKLHRATSENSVVHGYFESQSTICYCETCHKIRGDELYHKRGEPVKEYAVPYGWCHFSIKLPNKAYALNVMEKWHVGYYGIKMESIRRILDSGDLHLQGEGAGGDSILIPQPIQFTEKSRPDSCGLKPILLSPTVRYAGCSEFSPKYRFVDPKTKRLILPKLLYKCVGPQSVGANEQIDPHFPNNELELTTKERGSTIQ